MELQRNFHSAGFKAKVALAAQKADRTVNQLAGQHDVRPTQIHAWKKQLLAGAETLFANGAKVAVADAEAREAELYEQIGRLKMELERIRGSPRLTARSGPVLRLLQSRAASSVVGLPDPSGDLRGAGASDLRLSHRASGG